MKNLGLKFNWLVILVLVLAGCETRVGQNNCSAENTHGANGIGLFLHYYVGIYGDNQPTWRGQWYSRQNLSIIAHLPTKSEFFIYVCGPKNNHGDATNNLHLIIQNIQEKSDSKEAKESWETISQEVSINKKPTRLNFNYLRSEFIGTRADTDRYSKSDQVTTVIYTACMTPERPASKALYSVAIAMIPVNTSEAEKERLLGVMNNFLREKITYYLK
jgi:hypothetical protein